jgi:hypothetical protein
MAGVGESRVLAIEKLTGISKTETLTNQDNTTSSLTNVSVPYLCLQHNSLIR